MHQHYAKNGISKTSCFLITFPSVSVSVGHSQRHHLSREPITLEERSSTGPGSVHSTRTGGLGCPTGGGEAGFRQELGRLRKVRMGLVVEVLYRTQSSRVSCWATPLSENSANIRVRLGDDIFHPLQQSGSTMSPNGLGWIIIDSLDTMMIMNLTSQLANARLWISRKLTWDQDQDVNTFETTIRMLGGLLAAHYLSTQLPGVASRRDFIYLEKSIDLADRLLGAYESPSGVPYASIDLRTARGIPSHDGGASSMAEAATVQMEMKYLAQLTGKEIYWRKAEKVIQVLDDNAMEDGLLPIFVSPDTGRFTTREIRMGSRGDSYYGTYDSRSYNE